MLGVSGTAELSLMSCRYSDTNCEHWPTLSYVMARLGTWSVEKSLWWRLKEGAVLFMGKKITPEETSVNSE